MKSAQTKKTAMDCVKIARDAKRPHVMDFIAALCDDFEELHGDRLVNDDAAMVAGFGMVSGGKASYKVLFLGHRKGATVEENMASNFGMVNPDGYRKAIAPSFAVTLISEPGMYLPAMMSFAIGFSSSRWIARFTGRAPNAGS